MNNPGNIVFITGSFVSNNCWDAWQLFFRDHGYKTLAPSWPFKKGSAEDQRCKHPSNNPDLTRLTLNELTTYYENIVKSYKEKPIVIGHSMGGLITQILVNRGLVAAGVAIHSVQPAGIFPYEFPLLRLGLKFLGLFSSQNRTYLMSFKDWQYGFANGMPLEEQKTTYKNYCIPESKRVNLGSLGAAARVDFSQSHVPLLFISGSNDNIISAHLNWRNYRAYKAAGSVTDYRELPGRTHFVLGQSTWREDAGFILDWLDCRLPVADATKPDVLHTTVLRTLHSS